VIKIAVGTTSKPKLQFLEEVLKELKLKAELEPFNVFSEVSDQPISNRETKRGSSNRAKNALKLSKEADFGLGIEIGYHLNQDKNYEIFCWATIFDNNKNKISAKSHKLLLPKFHQNILKENKYLGEFVRQYLDENKDEFSQEIGIIIRDRKPFIQTAVKTVLINYFVHLSN